MRTTLIKTAAGYLAIASLLTCPFISSEAVAIPSGDAFTTTSTLSKNTAGHTQARPLTPEKDAVLVRNSPIKAEPTPTATSPKEKKTAEKKTISRCWKRLMNMAREIRYAHTKSKK